MREFDVVGLALALKGRRLLRGLDLRAAAKEVGISAATLGRVENGKEPSLSSAVCLCEWLALPLDSFVRVIPPFGKSLTLPHPPYPIQDPPDEDPLPRKRMCHATPDGECTWKECPQLRDGEPKKSGRSCPLPSPDDDAL